MYPGTELHCLYGDAFVTFLKRIWDLGTTHPLADIEMHANGIKSCFRRKLPLLADNTIPWYGLLPTELGAYVSLGGNPVRVVTQRPKPAGKASQIPRPAKLGRNPGKPEEGTCASKNVLHPHGSPWCRRTPNAHPTAVFCRHPHLRRHTRSNSGPPGAGSCHWQ